jgi:hypothetical protein
MLGFMAAILMGLTTTLPAEHLVNVVIHQHCQNLEEELFWQTTSILESRRAI